MKENNEIVNTLHELLDYDTARFTSAEIKLKKVLPSWIDKASSLMLKTVLQRYLDFVQQHVSKMEVFFGEEEINSMVLHSRIMEAFIIEAEEKLAVCADMEVRDACLLAAVQSINHFKISTYGTAAAFAIALGMERQAAIFHEAEVNEKQIDDRLTQLAEYEINIRAKSIMLLHS